MIIYEYRTQFRRNNTNILCVRKTDSYNQYFCPLNHKSTLLAIQLQKLATLQSPKRKNSEDLDLRPNPRKTSYISSTFILSIIYFSQQHHTLHMHRLWKHIHRLHLLHFIPTLTQYFHISRKCCWIATHIHNFLWLHRYHRFK